MQKKEKVRWSLIIVSVILGAISLCLYFKPDLLTDLAKYVSLPDSLKRPDWGGIASLFATVTIISVLRVHETIYNSVGDKYVDHIWRVIILLFALVGLTAIWLGLRTFGLYFMNYITQSPDPNKTDFIYTLSQIFLGLSSILAGNLCFTLLRTFARIGKDPNKDKELNKDKEPDRDKEPNKDMIPELVEVAIQAVVIGLIAFMPRYGDQEFLKNIGGDVFRGSQMYVVILMALIISLVLLILTRTRLAKKIGFDDIYGR